MSNEELHLAAREGDETAIRQLLEGDVDVDAKYDGQTPLRLAARWGHREVVRMLLKMNPDTDISDSEGNTALLLASQYGHKEVVRLLLKEEVEMDIDAQNNSGQTALHIAANQGYEAIVQILLNQEADVDKVDDSGNTALMLAAQGGHYKVLQLLDPNPLYEALFKEKAALEAEVVRLKKLQSGGDAANVERLKQLLKNEEATHQVDVERLERLLSDEKKGHVSTRTTLNNISSQDAGLRQQIANWQSDYNRLKTTHESCSHTDCVDREDSEKMVRCIQRWWGWLESLADQAKYCKITKQYHINNYPIRLTRASNGRLKFEVEERNIGY